MTFCKSCGGSYNQVQADGTQYFHRCPPLSLPELTAAVAAGKVTLAKGETPEDAIQRRIYERAALRDENLPGTKLTDAGKMKALGTGTLTLVDPEPAVVTVLL